MQERVNAYFGEVRLEENYFASLGHFGLKIKITVITTEMIFGSQ